MPKLSFELPESLVQVVNHAPAGGAPKVTWVDAVKVPALELAQVKARFMSAEAMLAVETLLWEFSYCGDPRG